MKRTWLIEVKIHLTTKIQIEVKNHMIKMQVKV